MEVNVINLQDDLSLNISAVKKAAVEIVHFEGWQPDEVTINFVTTELITELHDKFFDDPTPTDCISFPMDGEESIGYQVLGEAFICPESAIIYANDVGGDPYEETLLYLVHTLLHLMGYDDIEEEDRIAMRAGEARHLENLKSLDITLRP
ncbi:MAG: rRNA maturation RNase YbeY [Chlamydiales bacterium]|nr:rRNA maturation RNase YbeY [Chlamydiia bacterium]MCP5508246.1 rRNA maturation RNase YbeY [Chlamydiales bacterium]